MALNKTVSEAVKAVKSVETEATKNKVVDTTKTTSVTEKVVEKTPAVNTTPVSAVKVETNVESVKEVTPIVEKIEEVRKEVTEKPVVQEAAPKIPVTHVLDDIKIVGAGGPFLAEADADEIEAEKPVEKNEPVDEPKKTARKKREIKIKETSFIEFAGSQVNIQDIIESAREHYKALYEKDNGALKSIVVYVKPEEGVAYYVANGVGSDDYKVGI